MSSGRALGVDLGTRRIGLALTDPERVIASPFQVLERSPRRSTDHAAMLAIARAHDVAVMVVGLPRSLSGGIGPAAQAVLDEVEELRRAAADELEIVVYDERLTTVVAEGALRDSGVRARDQRAVVDKVAAAVLLQGWLEAS